MLRNWILVSLLLSFGFTGTQAETGNYSNRSDVTEFVAEMAQEGFDRQQLLNLFSDARYQQSVIDAISRPAERRLAWRSQKPAAGDQVGRLMRSIRTRKNRTPHT